MTTRPEPAPPRPGAGLGWRITAGLVDTVFVILLMWVFAGLGVRVSQLQPFFTFLAAIMCLLYFVAFEGFWCTTPGKRLFGMRVVKIDGSRPDSLEHVLRGMTRVPEALFVLPYVIAVVASPVNQRLGDRVTDTLVVRGRDPGADA